MLDPYDLLLNKDLAKYWKENNIFSNLEGQASIIMQAYTSEVNKWRYMESLKERFPDNILIEKIDSTIKESKMYYNIILGKNNTYIPIFKEISVDQDLGSRFSRYLYFNYEICNKPTTNVKDIFNHYNNPYDMIIPVEVTFINKETNEIDFYGILIFSVDNLSNYIINYMEIFTNTISRKFFIFGSTLECQATDHANGIIPIYPYKKIKIKTPFMFNGVEKFIHLVRDCFNCQYYYLSDMKSFKSEQEMIDNSTGVPDNIFHGLNLYDWIEEVKE